RARDRAHLRTRAGTAAQADGGPAVKAAAAAAALTIAVGSALATLAPSARSAADSFPASSPDDRYAGLQWRFVRIKYHYITEGTNAQQEFYGEPWYIDAPAAEQNLSRRIKTATAIHVEDPIVLSLDDPRLVQYPWIYFVEPGNLKLLDSDV